MISQLSTTSKFYLFGKKSFTQSGWEKAQKCYPTPDIISDPTLNLTGKVYMITGTTNGIGKEIAYYLASKGATIYMVCRNLQRAQKCKDDIYEATKNENVYILVGDCALESDIRRIWNEFLAYQQVFGIETPSLHGLICNAGALLNVKRYTTEGVEEMFASHLLFGTYLLGSLAIPTMLSTENARMIVVSSGGIYNTKFPSWELATSTGTQQFDGQFVYSYAKRGQVLLCERWAKEYGHRMLFISCHPGWCCDTVGLEKAYGDQKEYFTPLRTPWQGAEGIIWLCIAPKETIQENNGGFFLDRTPQVKHLSGWFGTETSFTKNTEQEIDDMMRLLHEWANGQRPSRATVEQTVKKTLPLQGLTSTQIDIPQFMGTWYILANIPTVFETNAMNCVEQYTLDTILYYDTNNNNHTTTPSEQSRKELEGGRQKDNTESSTISYQINAQYTYKTIGRTLTKTIRSHEFNKLATVQNTPYNSHWKIEVKALGLLGKYFQCDYLILDIAEDYSYALIGLPDRSYLWILTRTRPSVYLPLGEKVMSVYEIEYDKWQDMLKRDSTALVSTMENIQMSGDESVRFISTTSTATTANSSSSVLLMKDTRYFEEKALLGRALRVAHAVGYDVHKILRVPWD